MRKIKYLISVILILSFIPFAPAYAQTTQVIDITETVEYQKLVAFGIISPEDGFEYYTTVPRGLFMSYVMKCALGYDEFSEQIKTDNPYSDVTDGIDGYKEILFANHMGIISSASEFRPDDDITIQEAAKIFVSILGYGELAEKKGGYPSGYMSVSNDLNIFKGTVPTQDGYLTAEGFVKALLNVLETEVVDVEAILKKKAELIVAYTTNGTKDLMGYVLDIYREEGIVDTNSYTSINGMSDLDINEIRIKGSIYTIDDETWADYLGYNVECYYKKDDNDVKREVLYIGEYKNECVTVESEYILKDAVTKTNFRYYRDEDKRKKQDLKIAKSATLIYNGGQKILDVTHLCPTDGSVTLIDNNRDKLYDVVVVMNYRTILVSGVSEHTHIISDLLGGTSIVLDPDDEKYSFFIEIDGESGELSDIAVRNVISYAESTGNKRNVKYVKVSTKYVEGKIDTIGGDEVSINGVEYILNKNMVDTVNLNDYGIFYLDINGKIVAKKLEKDVVYGYLNEMYKENGIKKKIQAQIFTENNRWVELDFADKITTNSGRKTAEEVYDSLGSDYRQLITYTVSDEGKINMLKTAETFEPYSDAEEYAIEQSVFRVYDEIESAKYRSAIKSFENSILVGDSTKIFMIPDQSENDAELEEFYMLSATSLSSDSTYKKITPYDLSRSRTAGALVIVGRKRSISLNSSFMIVEGMCRSRNSDDDFVDAVRGHYMSSLITLPVADDSVFSELSEPLAEGDIIQFRMDDYGNVSEVELRYDASKGDEQKFLIEALYSWRNFVAGTIHYTDVENNKIIANGEEQKIIMGTDKNTVVYLYDREDNTVTAGTISDIQKGCGFFARLSYYLVKEIIVFV